MIADPEVCCSASLLHTPSISNLVPQLLRHLLLAIVDGNDPLKQQQRNQTDPNLGPFPFAKVEVQQRLANDTKTSFATLQSQNQVEAFVLGLFNSCGSEKEFATHMRDFLISVKAFGGPEELHRQEMEEQKQKQAAWEAEMRARIPGMVGPVTLRQPAIPADEDDDL